MNILVTAATELELKGLKSNIETAYFPNILVSFLATGIGGVAMAYTLTKVLQQSVYDLVLNIGIAGSFTLQYSIGQTVLVESDTFADLGIGTPQGFQTLFDEGLANKNRFPYKNGWMHCPYVNNYKVLQQFPYAKGITVNTTSGSEDVIGALISKFNPEIESMEGAAFFLVCLREEVPFLQIRSISNRVETRNREAWNIPLALRNLNSSVMQLLTTL